MRVFALNGAEGRAGKSTCEPAGFCLIVGMQQVIDLSSIHGRCTVSTYGVSSEFQNYSNDFLATERACCRCEDCPQRPDLNPTPLSCEKKVPKPRDTPPRVASMSRAVTVALSKTMQKSLRAPPFLTRNRGVLNF